ncbi:MAG: metallophosphoesterase [Cryobacterium sp.]|nr:metallophosphoesterase [Cryobacterium sp.]
MSDARRSGAKLALATLGTAALAAFAWGSLVERNRFRVRKETIPILDPGATPIRILHLSDLHMAPWQQRKIDWLNSLSSEQPDLVIVTGDSLGHSDGLQGLVEALSSFRETPGVFVHGSNDYFAPQFKNPFGYFSRNSNEMQAPVELDTEALERFFENLGWENLNNTALGMELQNSRLELAGTDDAHLDRDRLDTLPTALESLREELGWYEDHSGPTPITIGVTHAPYQRVLNAFVTNGADVIFAGHTHGGQVQVPGIGALVTNCDLPRSMASGLHLWRHAQNAAFLEVSAGVGTSIFAPVRFSCQPEAVLVTLTGDDFGYS